MTVRCCWLRAWHAAVTRSLALNGLGLYGPEDPPLLGAQSAHSVFWSLGVVWTWDVTTRQSAASNLSNGLRPLHVLQLDRRSHVRLLK
mmetsp:Transcript_35629/g.105297  ORF Transcript_35629/g.105297 Transcript_35629/m.105297 type:complete len:88 (+) Transcript_35629:2328-2591(+)